MSIQTAVFAGISHFAAVDPTPSPTPTPSPSPTPVPAVAMYMDAAQWDVLMLCVFLVVFAVAFVVVVKL